MPSEHDEPEWDDHYDDLDEDDEDDEDDIDDLLAVPDLPPHPNATKLVVQTVSAEPAEPILSAGVAPSWSCSGCAAKWKQDPGLFHSHEVPVPGSKSRVTYENFSITKAGG